MKIFFIVVSSGIKTYRASSATNSSRAKNALLTPKKLQEDHTGVDDIFHNKKRSKMKTFNLILNPSEQTKKKNSSE